MAYRSTAVSTDASGQEFSTVASGETSVGLLHLDSTALAARVRELSWLRWAAIAVTALGSILLWLPYLNLPLHVDTAGYAVVAHWWLHGDGLYRDITITRPQGIFVVFGLIETLGLGSLRGIHIAAAIYAACCTLALFAVARRAWSFRISLLATICFAGIIATPYLEAFTANAELFMLLPLLGSLYCLLCADKWPAGSSRQLIFLALSGMLGAIALLIKPAGAVALILGGLWLLRRWRLERHSWQGWLGDEATLAAGFIVGLAPAVVHGLLTAPAIYWHSVLFYRLGQDSVLSAPLGYQLYFFVHNSLYLLARLPILLVGTIGLLLGQARQEERYGRDLLWLWSITSFGGVALGGNWFTHYYLQLLPPVAVAIALGLTAALDHQRSLARRAVLQGACLAGLLILSVTLVTDLIPPANPGKFLVGYTAADVTTNQIPANDDLLPPAYREVRSVATYLQQHTQTDDTIYVAYQEPAIYYQAQRRPAARWLYLRELRGTPGAFDKQINRLANPATAPRYIVEAQAFDRWGFDSAGRLREIVARDYRLETTIDGINLYRRVEH
jgi:hypothetical protein